MLRVRKSWIFLIVGSLTLSLLVPALYGGRDSLSELARVPLEAIATLLAMVFLGWGFNAARLRLLAQGLGVSIPRRRAYGMVLSAEFAGVATPAGAGNPATYMFLLSRQGLALSDGAALVALDHFMDLVFFLTAVPVALTLYLLEGGVSHPIRLVALITVLILIGVAALVLLVRYYRRIALWIGRLMQHVPRLHRVRFRLARGLVSFRRSVSLMLGMGTWRLLLLYVFCLCHWMLRYGILPVLLWYLGESVPWGYLFVMQGVLLFIGQITVLPAGGGGVEVGFSALLAPYLTAATTASVLLIWRFCTFYWYLLAGAPVFVLMTGDMAGRLMGTRAPKEGEE